MKYQIRVRYVDIGMGASPWYEKGPLFETKKEIQAAIKDLEKKARKKADYSSYPDYGITEIP